MADVSKEFTSEIDELIIEMVRGQNLLYDKTEEAYHKEYRKERIEILDVISQAIFQIFQVNISGEAIQKRWFQLVKKFKVEVKKVQTYCPSGSGNNKESTWELFEAMLWLQPYLEHLPQISSNDFDLSDSTSALENTTDQNKQFQRKRKQESHEPLEKIIETNIKMIKSIENDIKNQQSGGDATQLQAINNFMRIIKIGFDQISTDLKYKCLREIIKYITEFKANINKK